jgi:hypothetical protein
MREAHTRSARGAGFRFSTSAHGPGSVAHYIYHETIDPNDPTGKTVQDFALSVAATGLGESLRTGTVSIFSVSTWIRAQLMPRR